VIFDKKRSKRILDSLASPGAEGTYRTVFETERENVKLPY